MVSFADPPPLPPPKTRGAARLSAVEKVGKAGEGGRSATQASSSSACAKKNLKVCMSLTTYPPERYRICVQQFSFGTVWIPLIGRRYVFAHRAAARAYLGENSVSPCPVARRESIDTDFVKIGSKRIYCDRDTMSNKYFTSTLINRQPTRRPRRRATSRAPTREGRGKACELLHIHDTCKYINI